MLLGPAGVGKRCAAGWLAARHLGTSLSAAPEFPLTVPQHADLRWLRPPDDKTSIGIDAVRALVADLALTSYSGRGKVAVIEPADAMTSNAANSLLKTLEEPPGNALLVLVVDRAGRLPATILSRCQRINIPLPSEQDSLSWLDTVSRSDHWAEALRQGGNAPLRALRENDRRDIAATLARDFAELTGNSGHPVETAARWMRLDIDFVLDWLTRQIQLCIRRSAGDNRQAGAVVVDSVAQRMDRRKLFCYLDNLWRIRSQAAGTFNTQLALECLLIDWADELQDCQPSHDSVNMQLHFAR
jgi:DNA polymerase-3 subunit delta'